MAKLMRWFVAQCRHIYPTIQLSYTYLDILWAFLENSLAYLSSFIGHCVSRIKRTMFWMQKAKSEVKTGIWNSYCLVKCVVIYKYSYFLCCMIMAHAGYYLLSLHNPRGHWHTEQTISVSPALSISCGSANIKGIRDLRLLQSGDCLPAQLSHAALAPWAAQKTHESRCTTRSPLKPVRGHRPLLVFAWQNKKGREISRQLTWISTELDALAPVRDSFSHVTWVDDMAFIACGAMQRLISILSGTAGLSCKRSL